jgi:hypothetical protein
MFRKSSMARATKIVVTALFVTLFSVVNPAANADFYNSSDLPIPNNPSMYHYFDQSGNGSVIATAEGCRDCYQLVDNGYAKVSTDGGATFTDVSSIGIQSWRAVEVSSDGTRIVFFAGTSFFISTNSGASFNEVDVFPASYIADGSEIIDGALSGDGKTIFIAESTKWISKLTYKTSLKRWTADYWVPNYADRVPTTIATNFTGSKTYIGSNQTGIASLISAAIALLPNTETWNGEILQWGEVRTSDSGNEIAALAGISSRGGTAFKSSNSGASFTAITSVNGQNVPHTTAVEISGDGNATFFGTSEIGYGYYTESTLYTQHGKTSPWFSRQTYYDVSGYLQIRSDYEGSTIIGGFQYTGFLRIFKGAPTPPRVTGISIVDYNTINIAWDAGFDAGFDSSQIVTDVIIEYSSSSTGPWSTYNDGVSGGNTGTITVTNLAPRNTHYFRIKSKNSFGTSVYSEIFSQFTYGTPSTPPAPTLLPAADLSRRFFVFNAPSDLGGADYLTESQWQYSLNNGVTWNQSSSATFSASFGSENFSPVFIVSGIPDGNSVSIRTRYSNGVVWSPWSEPTTAAFYSTPTAPRDLQVSTVVGNATLTWNPPASFGGFTLSQYSYGYQLSNTPGWTAGTTTDTTTTITGLTVGANYDFFVRAETVNGPGSIYNYSYKNLTTTPARKLGMNRNSAGAKSGEIFTTQPKVNILDANNSVVTADSVSLVYASVNKGARIIGTETVTAVSGVATFSNLGIKGVAGTEYTITYKSSDLTVATETFTLTAGPKASLKFVQKTVGGVNEVVFPTQPQIELLDSEGNRVTWDETTTVTMTTNNGTFGNNVNSETVRASAGLISFSGQKIRATAGATATLTYSSSGLTSIRETLTVTIGAPSAFERVRRAQNAFIGGVFGTQPTYKIIDVANNLITTGDYYISVAASQGTLTGQTTVKAVNGIATFTNLGITGVNASQLVMLTVTSEGLNPYTGDSVITVQGTPRLSWNNYYIPQSVDQFTIPAPSSNAQGTFSYSSSNTNVLTISGSTATIVGAGSAVITATFTPTNTTNYSSGEYVMGTFNITQSAGSLIVALSGGSTVAKGVIKTITATASAAGTVTFYINGRKVAGCGDVKTQSSVATCNWKPSVQGSAILTATWIPTNTQILPVTSTALNLAIGRRTGRR